MFWIKNHYNSKLTLKAVGFIISGGFSTLRLTLEFYDILSMIRKAKGDDTDDLEIEAKKR